jgi:3-hydroxy acid dehydrogenase / malonic semialdehyde reductase
LNNKNVVWITGASAGIGKALSIKFVNSGHRVIGSGRRSEIIDDLGRKFQNSGNLKYYKNDVSNSEDVSNLVELIQRDYQINCLINNAGVTSFKPFVDNNLEDIENIIDINLKGPIYAIKSVLPQMIANKSGTIINILSVAAKKVFTSSSIYAASKAGLEAFSKVIREELREYNIKVINIYPGATSTDIWPENAIEKFSNKMMTPEKLADFVFDIYSNSKFLSPEEIVVRPITGDL